jgi:glucose/arabinose dehydrogenase
VRTGCALVGASTLFGVGAVPAQASQGHHSEHGSRVVVVADHLNNPRQIAVHGGALYVAEAGTGGSTCVGEVCVGLSGSVTKVAGNHQHRVQTGLLSVATPEGDVVGVDALAFKGDRLYGVATGACDLAGLPSRVIAQAGKVLRLDGGNKFAAVGDASSFECTTDPDPDGQGRDTDPYGLAVRGHKFYVADAAGNDVVRIASGSTTLSTVLSTVTDPQPVPTSLAFGPDGALYIGTLNFEAGPGGAKVYRYDPATGATKVYASGLTAITAIAFGPGGQLYVSEWTTGFDPNTGPSPNGDVVVIPWGGGTSGRHALGQGALHFPAGVAVTNQGLYVSNWSIASGEDGPFGPGNHGQLVRIALSGR